jgi:hypothetical protein
MARFTAFAFQHRLAIRVLAMAIALAVGFHHHGDPVPLG